MCVARAAFLTHTRFFFSPGGRHSATGASREYRTGKGRNLPHLLSLFNSKWPISLNLYGSAGKAKDYSYSQGPTPFPVRSIAGIDWEFCITHGDGSLQRHVEVDKFGLRVVGLFVRVCMFC